MKLPRAVPCWLRSGEKRTVCPTANLCTDMFNLPGAAQDRAPMPGTAAEGHWPFGSVPLSTRAASRSYSNATSCKRFLTTAVVVSLASRRTRSAWRR